MIYETVEVVIDKTIRTHRLKEWQFDIEELVEDIAEALKLIGAAKVFEEKVATIEINGGYGPLPKDLQHIKSLLPTGLKYRESGSFIEMDEADGTEVTLAYQAMPVDARGYILVPDNAAVREAIMWYLTKILILQGEIKKIPFQMAESEWQWRCGSARADLNTWSIQDANNAYQDFVRLNPAKDQHLRDYPNLGAGNTLDREKNLNEYRTQ